jgi:cytochrome c-type biogenesis protein CcmF
MEYLHEHTLAGNIGRLFAIMAFVAALFSAYAYAQAERKKNGWLSLGRWSFIVHSLSVIGIMGSLYYLIFSHAFEYQYVWQHSAKSLPLKYMISCLWEGQEGSFLLWSFWQVLLGLILIRTAGKFETGVMLVFGLVQAFLASMLLGVYVFGTKIGSSPFILIRELPEYIGMPFTQMPDYLESPQFQDGRGLNPLLQNYWMVIHPPTLFLGFAAVLVPYAFAMTSLWRGQVKKWIKPALSWTFFAIMILGLGILMGGAWAYEALSFGGFWAWDPVENAILVPWLTLVGAGHLMLLEKARGGNLTTTISLVVISFILVLYSTFLTRSGILGDSSVHAFVDLGLNGQLLLYLLFFVFGSLALMIWRRKKMRSKRKEDPIWTREFWMFIGAMVLTISSFQITFSTSIPVLNKLGVVKLLNPFRKLLGMDVLESLAPPLDPIAHYNSWQVPFAIIIALLIAFTQFLKYKKGNFRGLWKLIWMPVVISLILSILTAVGLGMKEPVYILLLFSSIFAVVANFDYWRKMLGGKFNKGGSSVAHIGFGLILVGALISNAQKTVISQNDEYIAKDFPQNENLLIELGDTLRMGDYLVHWKGERNEGIYRYFDMEYFREEDDGLELAFTLSPFIQLNEMMGNVAEPATRHFLTHDIYTHITYAEPPEQRAQRLEEGYGHEAEVELNVGDTAIYQSHFVILDSLEIDTSRNSMEMIDLGLIAHLRLINIQGLENMVRPSYRVYGQQLIKEEAFTEDKKMKFVFEDVLPESGKIRLKAWKDISDEKEFVVMKAIIFPYINLLWLGSILMCIGTILAVVQRIRRT